ncbi:MAG: hypothetical protein ACAI38_11155 [Myxococcota bacterium]
MIAKRDEPRLTAAEFFDGVAEMRVYLDRNKAQRGREQLTRMAFELTRSRSAEALAKWLCEATAQALEARAVALVLKRAGSFVRQAGHGVVQRQPGDAELNAAIESAAAQHLLLPKRGGSLAALVGSDRPIGAMWIEHEAPLDPGLTPLLLAVVDAGAMALEAMLLRPAFVLERQG